MVELSSVVHRLPLDVSRCPGTRCEIREACLRHTAETPQPAPTTDFSALGRFVDRAEACANFITNSQERP